MQEIITKIIVGLCILIAIGLTYRRWSGKSGRNKRHGNRQQSAPKGGCKDCDDCFNCPLTRQCADKNESKNKNRNL